MYLKAFELNILVFNTDCHLKCYTTDKVIHWTNVILCHSRGDI